MQCPVLRVCYAMSSTETAYAGTRRKGGMLGLLMLWRGGSEGFRVLDQSVNELMDPASRSVNDPSYDPPYTKILGAVLMSVHTLVVGQSTTLPYTKAVGVTDARIWCYQKPCRAGEGGREEERERELGGGGGGGGGREGGREGAASTLRAFGTGPGSLSYLPTRCPILTKRMGWSVYVRATPCPVLR
eukprot:2698302-Rhodomonas_salina.4